MELIQILIVIFALFALSRAILRFRDSRLSLKELVFWVVLWAVILLVSFIPGIISSLSGIFGIGRGIDLAVYVSIILLFYLIFRLYVKIECVGKEVTLLVRRISFDTEKNKPRKKERK